MQLTEQIRHDPLKHLGPHLSPAHQTRCLLVRRATLLLTVQYPHMGHTRGHFQVSLGAQLQLYPWPHQSVGSSRQCPEGLHSPLELLLQWFLPSVYYWLRSHRQRRAPPWSSLALL